MRTKALLITLSLKHIEKQGSYPTPGGGALPYASKDKDRRRPATPDPNLPLFVVNVCEPILILTITRNSSEDSMKISQKNQTEREKLEAIIK